MAKREAAAPSKRLYVVFLILIAAIGWWLWDSGQIAQWKDNFFHYVDNREITTLESRYRPEQIVENHRKELFGNEKKTLHNTIVKYYPYLLLEIKYTDDQKTREGVLLWGMNSGEMVLNTETWETTHGFRDCLECKASRNDFKVLQGLAKRQGPMSLDELQKELKVEREVLELWVEGAKQKHLVVQKGNQVQLHFENPKLVLIPETKIKQSFVSKPLGEDAKTPKTYTRSQMVGITQTAFGNDLMIRSEEEVFLPVYRFEVLNPDGSLQSSEWNALTGKQMVPHYLK